MARGLFVCGLLKQLGAWVDTQRIWRLLSLSPKCGSYGVWRQQQRDDFLDASERIIKLSVRSSAPRALEKKVQEAGALASRAWARSGGRGSLLCKEAPIRRIECPSSQGAHRQLYHGWRGCQGATGLPVHRSSPGHSQSAGAGLLVEPPAHPFTDTAVPTASSLRPPGSHAASSQGPSRCTGRDRHGQSAATGGATVQAHRYGGTQRVSGGGGPGGCVEMCWSIGRRVVSPPVCRASNSARVCPVVQLFQYVQTLSSGSAPMYNGPGRGVKLCRFLRVSGANCIPLVVGGSDPTQPPLPDALLLTAPYSPTYCSPLSHLQTLPRARSLSPPPLPRPAPAPLRAPPSFPPCPMQPTDGEQAKRQDNVLTTSQTPVVKHGEQAKASRRDGGVLGPVGSDARGRTVGPLHRCGHGIRRTVGSAGGRPAAGATGNGAEQHEAAAVICI